MNKLICRLWCGHEHTYEKPIDLGKYVPNAVEIRCIKCDSYRATKMNTPAGYALDYLKALHE